MQTVDIDISHNIDLFAAAMVYDVALFDRLDLVAGNHQNNNEYRFEDLELMVSKDFPQAGRTAYMGMKVRF